MSKIVIALAMFIGLSTTALEQTVHAQKSSKSDRGERSASFEERFWQYLLSNNYKNWAPPAGQNGNFFAGDSVHGNWHKLYLNRTAASDSKALTDKSVIVMENYDSNKNLTSISVMLRSEGSNPLQKDWFWVTYGPDGTVIGTAEENHSDGPVQEKPNASFVSTTGAMVVSSSCTQCHQKASGNDYVYFNGDDAGVDSNSLQVKLSR